MSRLLPGRGVLGASAALLLAALVPAFASCADAEQSSFEEEGGSFLPPAPEGGLAHGEAGCDGADDACTVHAISCEEAAFCPVATGASAFYVLTTVWGSSKNDVWAAGSGGTIVHFDGTTWTPTPTDVKNTFRAVTGSGPGDVWAVSASDVLLHTKGFTPSGTTWTREIAAPDPLAAGPIYAAFGTPSGDLRIGGSSFGLTTPGGDFVQANQYVKHGVADGGAAWSAVAGRATIHGIWASAPDDVWLLADNSAEASWQLGLTMHGTKGDGGDLVWNAVDSQAEVVLGAIWGSSKTDVWAVGDVGTIRHLAADGSRWDVVDANVTANLHGVWGASASDVWAVGDAGTILHFDGKQWKAQTAAFPEGKARPDLRAVWGANKDDVWIVGDGIALRATGLGGGT
ncbi:MAG: Type fimbrial biosis protein PilY1 [Labilithrix sp.]|nr:Type fimbrial biosis protein PilY1 [Labilithrix sp.]